MERQVFQLECEDKERHLKIETTINTRTNNERRDFVARVDFYKNDTMINPEQLSQEDFDVMMEQYRHKVMSIDKPDSFGKPRSDNFFFPTDAKPSFWSRLKNFVYSIDVATSSLNVIMVDSRGESIARTTIEIDSDVITLLKPNLQGMNRYFKVQGINVLFVNKVFKNQVYKLFDIIQESIRHSKKIIWFLAIVINVVQAAFTLVFFAEPQNWIAGLDIVPVVWQAIVPVLTFVVVKKWPSMLMLILRMIFRIKFSDLYKKDNDKENRLADNS